MHWADERNTILRVELMLVSKGSERASQGLLVLSVIVVVVVVVVDVTLVVTVIDVTVVVGVGIRVSATSGVQPDVLGHVDLSNHDQGKLKESGVRAPHSKARHTRGPPINGPLCSSFLGVWVGTRIHHGALSCIHTDAR